MEKLEIKRLEADILIAGGGTAGCYAALQLAKKCSKKIIIAEKANIKRSGCLAAGVNALNAYITKGRTPDFYVDYAEHDAEGIARGDLLLTMAQNLNECASELEKLGLVILKNKDGSYAERGTRNIKINGENIKVLLADAVQKLPQVKIYNRINIIDFLVEDNKVYGAVAIDVLRPVLYIIKAEAVLCATGGAAGLYKPNNPGFSRHKMWYCPFNTGAGIAAGMRGGAEMTTLEMRFIALRCKDTIAPTGTIAQGVGAKQINAYGEMYEKKYGLSTANRLYGTVRENELGSGPCFLRTQDISKEQESDLFKAYLNMAPSQTLRWTENDSPRGQNVEIEGTEPYIVGGHGAAGFWIDTKRQTTVKGLFAAGDTAGGCPQKYVTGAMAEAAIASDTIIKYLSSRENEIQIDYKAATKKYLEQEEKYLNNTAAIFSVQDVEEAMQKVMDDYAGGIKTSYKYNEAGLKIASAKIKQLQKLSEQVLLSDMHELTLLHEVKDRLEICLFLIGHLLARKETRWHSFAENSDYPQKDKNFLQYINSRLIKGKIKIIYRPLVKRGEIYEHQDR